MSSIRIDYSLLVLLCLFMSIASVSYASCDGGFPNGIKEQDEQCDDNNTTPEDGCSPSCELEACAGTSLQKLYSINAITLDPDGDNALPLADLGAGKYKNIYEGGLYPGGLNIVPAAHAFEGMKWADAVMPLNTIGDPDPAGKIVLLSIGFSSTAMEFCSDVESRNDNCAINSFKDQVLNSSLDNDDVKVINGAGSGQTARYWDKDEKTYHTSQGDGNICPDSVEFGNNGYCTQKLEGIFCQECETEEDCIECGENGVNEKRVCRLGQCYRMDLEQECDEIADCSNSACFYHYNNYNDIRDCDLADGLSEKQVQAVWVKVEDPFDITPGDEDYRLLRSMGDIARVLKNRYENLKLIFFSSPTYRGYTSTIYWVEEPRAYEKGFAVKWLVESQIRQNAGEPDDRLGISGQLKSKGDNHDTSFLAWGPYMWADGENGRLYDNLVWNCADFSPDDGAHPSAESGISKVGDLLFDFFLTSPFTTPWFSSCTSDPIEVAGNTYSTLQSAYATAQTSIQSRGGATIIQGDIIADESKAIALNGGYDCAFNNRPGTTKLKGDIHISKGTVTISNYRILN